MVSANPISSPVTTTPTPEGQAQEGRATARAQCPVQGLTFWSVSALDTARAVPSRVKCDGALTWTDRPPAVSPRKGFQVPAAAALLSLRS